MARTRQGSSIQQAGSSEREPAREQQVQAAIQAIEHDKFSVKKAAEVFSVPRTTLRNRIKGVLTRKDAQDKKRILSSDIEDVLVDWICFKGRIGRPVQRREIRPKVKQLTGRLPSLSWVSRFLRRHPELKSQKPSGLDPKRAQAFNRPNVNEYFEVLDKVMREKAIPWENVYNMDEKGIQLGGGRKGSGVKYIFSRSERPKYVIRDGNLELVTIIESCCADGSSVMPGFVFAGQSVDINGDNLDPNIW